MISVQGIPAFKDNYIWALVHKFSHKVVIVDPGDAVPVLDFLKQQKLTLVGILITHHHWDHTNGINDLLKHADVPVFAFGTEKVAQASHPLKENDRVSIDDFPLTFGILSIPGHTLGHIAYLANGMLFCGDTLFAAGCGKIFEGTPAQMYNSLLKIANLPNSTQIFCGHEYTLNNLRFAETVEPNNPAIAERIQVVTKLRQQGKPSLPSLLYDEKNTNPFLRCDKPEIKSHVEQYANEKCATELDVFTHLRRLKDNF